jgi:hypothetical protein
VPIPPKFVFKIENITTMPNCNLKAGMIFEELPFMGKLSVSTKVYDLDQILII